MQYVGSTLVSFSFLEQKLTLTSWFCIHMLYALFGLCSPSSLDAIFLAHGLVVLQALPVSVAARYQSTVFIMLVLR